MHCNIEHTCSNILPTQRLMSWPRGVKVERTHGGSQEETSNLCSHTFGIPTVIDHAIHLVQWSGWVFEKERKKELDQLQIKNFYYKLDSQIVIRIRIKIAIPSYQRRPSSLRKREGNVRFPTNLLVRRSPRPTSRWAPKVHRMMGKTQWRHCEQSFGTNVLVLGKERVNFPLLSEPLKTDVNQKFVIARFLN